MPPLDENKRIVLVSVPSKESALHIARRLVEQKLAACVNIIPGIKSVYRWQGKIEEDSELLLIIKTSSTRYKELQESVVHLHPYDTPEVISLGITEGFEKYLDWIDHATSTEE